MLAEADLAMANVEAPLTTRDAPTVLKTKADIDAGREFVFRAGPAATK